MAAALDLSRTSMSCENHDLLQTPLEVSDYLLTEEERPWNVEEEEEPSFAGQESLGGSSNSSIVTNNNIGALRKHEAKAKKQKTQHENRIGFRTKSVVEILEDGYRWRKYGKKSVKNSPNPRNYYKCNTNGCNVKKRVERDRDDPNYVLTVYEGTHNHECPTAIYSYNYGNYHPSSSIADVHPWP